MYRVTVHYDGWIALPEIVRSKLGIRTDQEMNVELVDGAIHLTPINPAPRKDGSIKIKKIPYQGRRK